MVVRFSHLIPTSGMQCTKQGVPASGTPCLVHLLSYTHLILRAGVDSHSRSRLLTPVDQVFMLRKITNTRRDTSINELVEEEQETWNCQHMSLL